MGMIQTYDDISYARSIIEQYMEVSDDIREYVDGKLYLIDFEDEDAVTDDELLDMLNKKVLDELIEVGIIINDIAELHATGYKLDILVFLHSKFTNDNHVDLLKNTSESFKASIRTTFDGTTEDVLFNIISILSAEDKTNHVWKYLVENRYEYKSNSDFVTLMRETLNNIEANDIDTPLITDTNIDVIKEYMEYKKEHIRCVNLAAKTLCKLYEGKVDDQLVINQWLPGHDLDLLSPEHVHEIAVVHMSNSKNEGEGTKLPEPEAELYHHKHRIHHFEYYIEHNISTVTMEQMLMLISDLYRVGITLEEYNKHVASGCDAAKFNDTDRATLYAMVSALITNLTTTGDTLKGDNK